MAGPDTCWNRAARPFRGAPGQTETGFRLSAGPAPGRVHLACGIFDPDVPLCVRQRVCLALSDPGGLHVYRWDRDRDARRAVPAPPVLRGLALVRRYHDEFNAMGYVYCWREKIEDGPRPVAYAACSVFADRDLETYIECSGDNEIRSGSTSRLSFRRARSSCARFSIRLCI